MKKFLLVIGVVFFAACSAIVNPDKDSLGPRPTLDSGEVAGCQQNLDCQAVCEDYHSFFCDMETGFCGCANLPATPPVRSSCTTVSSGGEFEGDLCSCPEDFEASCVGSQCTCSRTTIVEVPVDGGTRTVYVDGGREIIYVYPDAGMTKMDSGQDTPDTGIPPPDTGIPIPDAGMDEDSGSQIADAGSDTGSPDPDPILCSVQEPCQCEIGYPKCTDNLCDCLDLPPLLIGNFFGLQGSADASLGTTNVLMGVIEFKVTGEDYLVTTLSLASDLIGDIDIPQDTSATLVVRLQYRDNNGQLQVVSMPLVGGLVTFVGISMPVYKAQVRALAHVFVDFEVSASSIGQQLRLGLLESQGTDSFYAVSMSGDEAMSWFTTEPAVGDSPTLYTLTP